MITSGQYYQYFYNIFLRKHKEEFQYCLRHDPSREMDVPKRGNYGKLSSLLEQIDLKYGFDMELNYAQLSLWQKEFARCTEEEALLAAGCFVLFCCLIDKFLDSPRFSTEQKEAVCEKCSLTGMEIAGMEIAGRKITGMETAGIEITGMEITGTEIIREQDFRELDLLIAPFIRFIRKQKDRELYSKEMLYTDINKAFRSEIYMYRSALGHNRDMEGEELSLLIDKSVRFEKAAFLTASFGVNSRRSVRAAEVLGRIFWLTDDLCDFVEDIREHRKNSLLVFCIREEKVSSLEERIEIVLKNLDIAVSQLEEDLRLLKELVSEEFYCFMMAQVWKWSYKVRGKAEKADE